MSTRSLRRRYPIPTRSTTSTTPIKGSVEKGKRKKENMILNSTLSNMDKILGELYDSRDTPIRTLSGDIKNKYNQAVSYVSILHDTEYFPLLSEAIASRFGGNIQYSPGTVGSYFGGCYVQDPILEGIAPGCTPSCLGSISPDGAKEGFNLCENQVLNMTWIGNSYLLTRLNATESGDALIYLDGTDSFMGFSSNELDQLKDMDISSVRIISSNQGRYREILQQTPIDSMESRPVAATAATVSANYIAPASSIMGSNTMLWIGAILVILLLIILLIWKR